MKALKFILWIKIICMFQITESQHPLVMCFDEKNKDIDYVWGKIDAFLLIDSENLYVFNELHLYHINHIRPNGVIKRNERYRINQNFSGVEEVKLLSQIDRKLFIYDKNNVKHVFQYNSTHAAYYPIENFNISIDYPFIREYESNGFKQISNILFLSCRYNDEKFTHCPFVSIFYKHNEKPILEFRYHNTISLEKSYIETQIPSIASNQLVVTSVYLDSIKENKLENSLNYTIFQSMHNFENENQSNVGAKYRLNINQKFDSNNAQTNSFNSNPFRVSTYRPNQMWFGCPVSLCLFAAIDGIANAFNDTLFVFSGAYFWRWNTSSGEYPRVKHAIQLQKQFQYIDAAFTDTQTGITYLFKKDRVLRFNDNHYNEIYDQEIYHEFKIMKFSDINAAIFDISKNQLYVYKGSYSLVYENKSYVNSDTSFLNNLNAAFTDDNGDKIFVKRNIAYRREYGVFKPFLIQQYFMCDMDYNYSRIHVPDINSWIKFKTDIETHEKLEDIPSNVTISSTPIHSTANSEETIEKQFTKLTTLSVESNTQSTVKTKITPKPKLGFKLWQFILIIVLFVLSIIIIILFYVFGYYFGKNDNIEAKRKLFKNLIADNKKEKSKKNTKNSMSEKETQTNK